jgi:hypothetical protein
MAKTVELMLTEQILDEFIYNYDYDGSNNLIYLGKAKSNTAGSDAAWSIVAFTYSGTNMVTKRWANGNTAQNNIWDNRVSLSYS